MFRHVEMQPWRATFGMVSTVQVFYMMLDLAVNTGVDVSWHNAVVTIEFLSAVFLASYQAVRISAFLHGVVWADKDASSGPLPAPNQGTSSRQEKIRKCMWLLWTSLLLQIVILIFAACSFRFDSPPIEWAVFSVALAWSIVNAWSFAAVRAVSAPADGSRAPDVAVASPFEAVGSAFQSTFARHVWPRERCRPWLYGSALLAVSHAAMVGLQGIMVDWIAELSSSVYYARQSGADSVSVNDVVECATHNSREGEGFADASSCETQLSWHAYGLVAVWFAATACRVMYRAVNSSLRLRLELWLRDRAFVVRRELAGSIHNSSADEETHDHPDVSKLQEVYEGDIDRVLRVHAALQEIAANGLLVVSNFAVLLVLSPKVGGISLSLVSLWAIVSGPPSSFATEEAPAASTTPSTLEGSALLKESPASLGDEAPRQRHRKHVLIPLEARWLRRTVYSDSAADVYVGVFASFLTVTAIVCMAWEVADLTMSPYRVLSVLFVLFHLLRAATSLPALGRQVASKWGSLINVDQALRLGGGAERVRKLQVIKELETSSESADDAVEQPSQTVPVRAVTATGPSTSACDNEA